MRASVAAVHVWLDSMAARGEYYSVSRVDEEGGEITCIGGSRSLARAWKIGTDDADGLGVPCVEYARATGEETDRYDPPEAESE